MREVRGLTPYALASVAIVLLSAAALAASVRDVAPPTIAARPAGAGLSDSSRLAYWRADADHLLRLWVSDLDGGRRRPIATADDRSEIALTHWSPDGGSVAYVGGASALGVAHVDGSVPASILLPADLRAAGWKIVSFEWSPDSTRVAATVRAANGLGNDSDVYVAAAKDGALWQRVTTIGDAYAGPWIDADRLFVETAGGMIAVLDPRSGSLRPFTGLPATSPQLGRDGRVYFVGGRDFASYVLARPHASGWVWSATIDGGDVRRESSAMFDQVRLFGMLADGRAAVGVPGGSYLTRDDRVVLSFRSGTVRSVRVASDGRHLVGWTGSRVLLIDAAKVTGKTAAAPEGAASVLIGEVADADVWYPLALPAPVHSPAARVDGPRARLAYTLGRSVWETNADGTTHQVASGASYYISPPRWSPAGDQLALVVTSGSPARAYAIVTGPTGTKRWEAPTLYPSFQWTPDGRGIVFTIGGGVADRGSGPQPQGWTTETRDADRGALMERADGRLIWTAAGRIALSDGDISTLGPARVGQRVELLADGGRRLVTDAMRLGSQLYLAGAPFEPMISEVQPFGDPAYVGVWLWKYASSQMRDGTFVVVRVSDGRAMWSLPITDFGSAPAASPYRWGVSASTFGRHVAWTESDRSDDPVERTFIADPVLGWIVNVRDGRFAGWSPDGEWVYVARKEGLSAARVDGGADVRVGPIGVPVSATRP